MPQTTSTLPSRRTLPGFELLILVIAGSFVVRPLIESVVDGPAIGTWSTIFVSTMLQAMPFLVLGVALSATIAAFVSPHILGRILPKQPAAAVITAGGAGVLLPGCECGSVPISGRLVAGGIAPAAAITFMLAAPAINPVVLIATAVAFPGQPEMVLARFIASLAAAVAVGLVLLRVDTSKLIERTRRRAEVGETRWGTFIGTARHDFLQAGGFLVLGAGLAASLQVVVPRSVLEGIGGFEPAAIVVMAVLAIALSICSEADAFVAASFTQVSPTAQLVFMVVGPAVDLKLASMQAGVFGTGFAARFAPATAVACTVSAVIVGTVLL